MGNWFSGMFKNRQTARPAAPEPLASPPEPADDPHARHDAEFEELKRAAGEAFTEMVARNGCYFPGDASPSLEAHRDRLRDARGGRRW